MVEEILSPLFTTEWGRRAGLGVVIIAGFLLFITIIQSLFTWHADFILSRSATVSSAANKHNENDVGQLIAHIPDRHLFGRQGIVEKGDVLPITSLQLHLMGVIKAVPETLSRVIISEHGQPGKVYQIGDTLPSGVTIEAITKDGVILENGGRLEKLPLPRLPLNFQGMPKSLISKDRTQEE